MSEYAAVAVPTALILTMVPLGSRDVGPYVYIYSGLIKSLTVNWSQSSAK